MTGPGRGGGGADAGAVTDVLVLRALGLGDLLTSVPALRGLRRAWPQAGLRLAAPAAVGGWLASLGVVDDVVPVSGLEDAGRAGALGPAPDVAVNLHGSGPQSHELLRGLGASRLAAYACPGAGHDDGPVWDDGEHEVDRWVRLSQWAGGAASADDLRLPLPGPRGDHVVIHPGAAFGSRWWPVGRWAAVARALATDGHNVLVTGTAAERERCAAVAAAAPGAEDLCGALDLPGLAHTVGTAALLVSADTGVAHVATAFGTPSVTLFGPVSPRLWGARTDEQLHRALWHGTPADDRPGDAHAAVTDPRLVAIDVDEVLEAAAGVLGIATV